MAMSKKEQAAFQAAIDRADTLAALRWTAPVERDVAPPASGGCYSEGWDCNVHSMSVWIGWSCSVFHGTGPAPKEGELHRSGSQNARRMFSTKARALAAMRHELERKAAADLMRIDRQIIEAMQETAPNDKKD